jgi:hypothetical protein
MAAGGLMLQAQDGGWLTFGITPNTPARWEAFALWLQKRAGYEGLIGAEFPSTESSGRSRARASIHSRAGVCAKVCSIVSIGP